MSLPDPAPSGQPSSPSPEVPRTSVIAGELARFVEPLSADALCEDARDAFAQDLGLFAVPVVDSSQRPVGLVNRFKFLERLAGRFGRELTIKKPVSLLMDTAPLILDFGTNIDELGTRLLARQNQYVFDGFIVTRDGQYAGLGTGLDLIRAFTERRHAELQRLAHHDMLTGLPNRTLFEQRLAESLSEANRTLEKVAVLFLDLDRFKEVNDSFGHRFGDLVLCGVSQRLRGGLRHTDVIARLSGDEFALVLPAIRNASDAETIAKVLLGSCGAPLTIENREVIVSCSIGLAIYPEDGVTMEGLLRAADAAQYHAKEVRNSWQRYSPEMEEWRPAMPGLSALRQALEAGQLEVHYQPIATIATARVTAVEALVRWTHEGFGAVPASDVVRLAEDSGLIVQLGEFVLRSALEQMRAWDRDTGRTDLRLSINVSAVQIHEGGLVAMVDRLLGEYGFDPSRLEVELTERTAMRASASALSTLRQLRSRGLTLTLDDFGTGYSALSRLERLPIDAMKIDKSFLEHVGQPGSGLIARAIIAMGRSLGVRIVGEGVETPAQLDFLVKEGCDCIQGFLLAPPMRGDALVPLLTSPSALESVDRP